jgi:hypothetical protein
MGHPPFGWATSNRRTNMVQTIVYSGCTETTVPCSPYCTCIRYGSNDRKKNSDHHIHHGESQTTRNDKPTMLKLTRNERERDSGRARSWGGKEGREGSLRKEVVINVEFAKKNECDTTIESSYQHGTNHSVQQVHVNYRTMQPVRAYDTVVMHRQYAWYKRYCTAGARTLLYHAARPVHAYDTVVTHRQ